MNVAGWVLGDDCDGVLGTNGGAADALDDFRHENGNELTPRARWSL